MIRVELKLMRIFKTLENKKGEQRYLAPISRWDIIGRTMLLLPLAFPSYEEISVNRESNGTRTGVSVKGSRLDRLWDPKQKDRPNVCSCRVSRDLVT
uniref:Uncharacterized protein n=1 Tax=Vespula pensylvanica TaxID=30213 RepID=A0A834NFB3_VESPE|nr:hypothetical protein H0235_014536 [Vespula pensylvanica]